ncbi:MAG: hypothetical protein MUF34_04695 [Polyangiaceae bacterium]|jgi:hypothetical protein|nr:hypothetical protein [Polyangiaceae bacterium]
MPITSLVLTLDARELVRHHALARLVADARVELGTANGPHLPAVLDTASAREGAELLEELLATPGVLHIDVVGVDFSLDEGA